MKEFKDKQKMDESNGIEFDDNEDYLSHYPYYLKVTKKDLKQLLKLIVQLPIVDLGARFKNRGIPCFCPFHDRFKFLLKEQKCYKLFETLECKCTRNDNRKGIYPTKDDLRDHCLASDDFFHRCLGYFLIYLYDPKPQPIRVPYDTENKETESDNDNNGEGVARMPNYTNR